MKHFLNVASQNLLIILLIQSYDILSFAGFYFPYSLCPHISLSQDLVLLPSLFTHNFINFIQSLTVNVILYSWFPCLLLRAPDLYLFIGMSRWCWKIRILPNLICILDWIFPIFDFFFLNSAALYFGERHILLDAKIKSFEFWGFPLSLRS